MNDHIEIFIEQLMCVNLFQIKEKQQREIIMQLKDKIKTLGKNIDKTMRDNVSEESQYSDTYSRVAGMNLEVQDSDN